MVTPNNGFPHIDPTAPNGAFTRITQAISADDNAMYDEVTARRAREHVKAIVEQARRIPAGTSDEDRTAVLLTEISEHTDQLTFTTVGEAADWANPSSALVNLVAHPDALTELLKEVNDGAIVVLLVAALDLLAQREPVTR